MDDERKLDQIFAEHKAEVEQEHAERYAREFTLDDRRKVKDMFDDILDEMGDCFTLDGMFAPYAEIVDKILTDLDRHIAQNETDKGANDKPLNEEDSNPSNSDAAWQQLAEDEAGAKLNVLRDYNA